MAWATSDVCYWRTWNVLCLIVACSVISASAQVRCYRNTTCGGSDFFDVDTIEDCCLSDDGVLVNGTGGCETCRVFGWISGATDPTNNNKKTISFLETGERQLLVVGFSKGIPTTDNYDILLRGTLTEGTARLGATADFRLEGDIGSILVSYSRVGSAEQGGPTTDVPAIIQIDNVALEPDEDFTLSFEAVATSPDNILTGDAVVIVNELQVFIVDQTDLTVQFKEFDYSQDENGCRLPVAVLITTEIASDLNLRIVTRNYTQVYTPHSAFGGGVKEPPIIPLPDGFAELDPFDPNEPYIASSVDGAIARVDYDTSTQDITFTAGPARTIQAPVTLFDDDIDEADEEYFVLFLETDDPRVDLTNGRFASRGIIRDNERTTIGFEEPEYSFLENQTNPRVHDTIFIIKEGNRSSELTFTIRILTAEESAENNFDFDAQAERTEEFLPNQDRIDVSFSLLDDTIPEGDESFQFEIANGGYVPFDTSTASTTITFLDNDDVVVGFEQTEVTVFEGEGQVELCLAVLISNTTLVSLTQIYSVGVETVKGTAGNNDYGQLIATISRFFFSDTVWRNCFNVTITDDILFEHTEAFTVVARENPPFFTDIPAFRVEPDVVNITILNQNNVVVGFEQTEFTVFEDERFVELCLAVLNHTPLISQNYSVGIETVEGTAGNNDYGQLFATTYQFVFSDTLRHNCFNVTITDDILFERTEAFTVVACENPPLFTSFRVEPDTVTITILDRDNLTLGFVETSYAVQENASVATVEVEVKSGSGVGIPVTLDISTMDISAIAPGDYGSVLSPSSLTFTEGGARVLPVNITIENDNLFENTEMFQSSLTLFSPVESELASRISIAPKNAIVSILNDDSVTIGFVPEIDFTPESENVEATLRIISGSFAPGVNRTVDVVAVDNTALGNNIDFDFTLSNYTFSDTITQNQVPVTIINDTHHEPEESFKLQASASDALVTVSPATATITILDNDLSSDNTVAIAVGTVAGVLVLVILVTLLIIIGVYCSRKKTKAKMNITLAQPPPKDSRSLSRIHGMSRIERAQKIIPYSKIRLLDSIGEGEYGIVYKAHFIKDVRSAPEIVAVKTLKQSYDVEGNSKIIQESLRMIGLDHLNVLGLIGVCVDAGPTPYLLMPYMGHGNLLSYLKKRRPKLVFDGGSEENANKRPEVEKKLLGMCLQIAKGMEYLRSKKLVHRDLAARNCMMDLNTVIKVADFGLTEDMYARNYFRQGKDSSVKLPMKWMAPESLSDCVFTEASDIWSFGVTSWEVYTGGRSPYPGIDLFTLQRELENGRRMDKPLNAVCSDEIYKMMLDCWNSDPNKRPTFSDLVVSFNTMLEQMAGYVDLTALQSEACENAGEQKLPAASLESKETRPQTLGLSEPSAKPHESSQSVSGFQLTMDNEERTERYITTPV